MGFTGFHDQKAAQIYEQQRTVRYVLAKYYSRMWHPGRHSDCITSYFISS